MAVPSFLLVDLGNSRLKWAIARMSGPIRVAGEVATAKAGVKEISALAKKYPRHNVVLSSVVPKLVPLFRRAFKGRLHVVTGTSPALGLQFDYSNPAELGADRLAVAVAARMEAPAIIISCGTATAFSVLNAKGRFCGGVIAPGLHTQLTALIGATAQLPCVTLRQPARSLARSTQEAIRTGVMLSYQGGVNEILGGLIRELSGSHQPRIILTGGDARYLTGSLGFSHTLRPLLVFEGLRIIGARAFIEE